MIRTEKRLRLCVFLLILNLAFIWGNSLMSAEASLAFSDWVKGLLDGLFGGSGGEGGSGVLRKIAHFTEFMALGMCLGWLFGMLQKRLVWPFFCGALAACIDETIQIFVPDRGPGIWDVCLDSSGVAAGLIVLHLGHTYWKRKSTQPILEDK